MNSDAPFIPPVIVGGLGGSGTRAPTALLQASGVWMGDLLDSVSLDSLPMRGFLARWFNPIVVAYWSGKKIPQDIFLSFHSVMDEHRTNIPDISSLWGWKTPRNLWLIPFFTNIFPSFKFVHVIRDVREMALSDNTGLLKTSGPYILGDRWHSDPEVSQCRLWALGNAHARSQAHDLIGKENYHVIRYEDLCQDPRSSIRELQDFLGLPIDDAKVSDLTKLIRPSNRLGKWRRSRTDKSFDLDPNVREVLVSFDYSV